MVVYELTEAEADGIFLAMADAPRRHIAKRAMPRDQSVSSWARHCDMGFAAVQEHVVLLDRASLIAKEPRGRQQIVRGNPEPLRRAALLPEADAGIRRQRLGRIGGILSEETKGTEP